MTDTILIWYNPDTDLYEIGNYYEFIATSKTSVNEDRYEIIYEFCFETISVADKILGRMNKVKLISSPLNI